MKSLLYIWLGIGAVGFFILSIWLLFIGEPWIGIGIAGLSLFHIHLIRVELEATRADVLQSTLLKLLKEKYDR